MPCPASPCHVGIDAVSVGFGLSGRVWPAHASAFSVGNHVHWGKCPPGTVGTPAVPGAPIAFTQCGSWRPSSLLLSATDRVSYAPGYALRCAFIPPVDHRSSYQLRSLTGADDNFSRTFDVCGMDRYGPFASLDPSADRVSDPPVLHLKVFRTAAFLGPPHTPCPKLVSKDQPRCDAAWAGGLLAQLLVPRLPNRERLQMSQGRPPVRFLLLGLQVSDCLLRLASGHGRVTAGLSPGLIGLTERPQAITLSDGDGSFEGIKCPT
jgi:hypothetical protein